MSDMGWSRRCVDPGCPEAPNDVERRRWHWHQNGWLEIRLHYPGAWPEYGEMSYPDPHS